MAFVTAILEGLERCANVTTRFKRTRPYAECLTPQINPYAVDSVLVFVENVSAISFCVIALPRLVFFASYLNSLTIQIGDEEN